MNTHSRYPAGAISAPSALNCGPDASLVAAVSTSNTGAENLRQRDIDIMISWVRQRGRREPLTVVVRIKPEAFVEGAAKRIIAPKANGRGDRFDLGAGPRQMVAGGVES